MLRGQGSLPHSQLGISACAPGPVGLNSPEYLILRWAPCKVHAFENNVRIVFKCAGATKSTVGRRGCNRADPSSIQNCMHSKGCLAAQVKTCHACIQPCWQARVHMVMVELASREDARPGNARAGVHKAYARRSKVKATDCALRGHAKNHA